MADFKNFVVVRFSNSHREFFQKNPVLIYFLHILIDKRLFFSTQDFFFVAPLIFRLTHADEFDFEGSDSGGKSSRLMKFRDVFDFGNVANSPAFRLIVAQEKEPETKVVIVEVEIKSDSGQTKYAFSWLLLYLYSFTEHFRVHIYVKNAVFQDFNSFVTDRRTDRPTDRHTLL